MKRQKVLFVFAHPDDEIICGWPLLQSENIDKEILICSSDAHNPARKWCRHRKLNLISLCRRLDIPCTCLDYDSEFYRTTPRKPRERGGIRRLLPRRLPPFLLRDVARTILDTLAGMEYDAVFTHNFWGEYGQMDHVFLNSIIFNNVTKPVYVTDMRIPLDWIPLAVDAPAQARLLEPHFHSACELDKNFYEECAAFYKSAKNWTWSLPPVPKLNVYCIQPAQPNHGSESK